MTHHPQIKRPADFGMDARPTSFRWSDLIKGPSLTEVGTHLAKLASFVTPTR